MGFFTRPKVTNLEDVYRRQAYMKERLRLAELEGKKKAVIYYKKPKNNNSASFMRFAEGMAKMSDQNISGIEYRKTGKK